MYDVARALLKSSIHWLKQFFSVQKNVYTIIMFTVEFSISNENMVQYWICFWTITGMCCHRYYTERDWQLWQLAPTNKYRASWDKTWAFTIYFQLKCSKKHTIIVLLYNHDCKIYFHVSNQFQIAIAIHQVFGLLLYFFF